MHREAVTPEEQIFLISPPDALTDEQFQAAQDRVEALQALAWSLGLLPELPAFDIDADPALPGRLDILESASYLPQAQLRPLEQLTRVRATSELWHWRSRARQLIEANTRLPPTPGLLRMGLSTYEDVARWTAQQSHADGTLPQVIDNDFPACGKAYRDLTREEWFRVRMIAVQRHFALNWVCGYAPMNEWDQTPTET